jgi:hypothetical protein
MHARSLTISGQCGKHASNFDAEAAGIGETLKMILEKFQEKTIPPVGVV